MSCSVHDLAEYEDYDVPAVLAASEQFGSASEAQARALGTDPTVVYVRHPIQDRTDDEMYAIAEAAVEELVAEITA